MTPFRWARLVAVIAAALLCLGLAACGDSDDDGASTGAATAAAGASTTAAATEGVDLKAGQFSWTAAAVQTEILAAIAAEHPELGVKSIESVRLDPAAGWVGLQRGDVDLLTEVNLPNQQAFADRARDEAVLAARVYDGAVQAWFVPRYAVEPGGPLEGLRSIDQLNDYKGEVNETLYDGDAGWITTQQNAKRLKAYDLDLRHAKSSEAALIAQVRRSYDKREPILFFFYRPHWLFQQFDVVQLDEPNPYRAGCFEGGADKCAIPAQQSWIAARSDLAERAPRFAAALRNVQIPLEEIESLLDQVDARRADPAVVARQWVDEHRAEVDAWVR
ncbi:glycine betaine ABC transporter substrate-binding protein [Conexibacter sp. CPCC 206217]|uniref:glycine betaine ABC transporter substrate-binding protein n=1 Tax=Conexibacter sp. CPCC 206217 TaxID=3064574 RepID=UPI002728909D|nr:glycine betaine ABC transporter substrate-binding protein [Conexibacter sp. CPCC 206217]MDO8212049.1 glycine betaine ABC transporter substrate-binding protein [Conexibacter sp. CPCC 206217]